MKVSKFLSKTNSKLALQALVCLSISAGLNMGTGLYTAAGAQDPKIEGPDMGVDWTLEYYEIKPGMKVVANQKRAYLFNNRSGDGVISKVELINRDANQRAAVVSVDNVTAQITGDVFLLNNQKFQIGTNVSQSNSSKITSAHVGGNFLAVTSDLENKNPYGTGAAVYGHHLTIDKDLVVSTIISNPVIPVKVDEKKERAYYSTFAGELTDDLVVKGKLTTVPHNMYDDSEKNQKVKDAALRGSARALVSIDSKKGNIDIGGIEMVGVAHDFRIAARDPYSQSQGKKSKVTINGDITMAPDEFYKQNQYKGDVQLNSLTLEGGNGILVKGNVNATDVANLGLTAIYGDLRFTKEDFGDDFSWEKDGDKLTDISLKNVQTKYIYGYDLYMGNLSLENIVFDNQSSDLANGVFIAHGFFLKDVNVGKDGVFNIAIKNNQLWSQQGNLNASENASLRLDTSTSNKVLSTGNVTASGTSKVTLNAKKDLIAKDISASNQADVSLTSKSDVATGNVSTSDTTRLSVSSDKNITVGDITASNTGAFTETKDLGEGKSETTTFPSIQMTSKGNLTAGNVTASNAATVNLQSDGTFTGKNVTASNTAQVTMNSAQAMTTGAMAASGEAQITAQNKAGDFSGGNVNAADTSHVTITSAGALTAGNVNTTAAGHIEGTSATTLTTKDIEATGDTSVVSLNGQTAVATGNVNAADGSQVTVTSQAATLTAGNVGAAGTSRVSLTAPQAITAQDLTATESGTLRATSQDAIRAGALTATGAAGAITLTGNKQVSTKGITTNDHGNVTISSKDEGITVDGNILSEGESQVNLTGQQHIQTADITTEGSSRVTAHAQGNLNVGDVDANNTDPTENVNVTLQSGEALTAKELSAEHNANVQVTAGTTLTAQAITANDDTKMALNSTQAMTVADIHAQGSAAITANSKDTLAAGTVKAGGTIASSVMLTSDKAMTTQGIVTTGGAGVNANSQDALTINGDVQAADTSAIHLDAVKALAAQNISAKGNAEITAATQDALTAGDVSAVESTTVNLVSGKEMTVQDATVSDNSTLTIEGAKDVTMKNITVSGTGKFNLTGHANVTVANLTSKEQATVKIDATNAITGQDLVHTSSNELSLTANNVTFNNGTIGIQGDVPSPATITGNEAVTFNNDFTNHGTTTLKGATTTLTGTVTNTGSLTVDTTNAVTTGNIANAGHLTVQAANEGAVVAVGNVQNTATGKLTISAEKTGTVTAQDITNAGEFEMASPTANVTAGNIVNTNSFKLAGGETVTLGDVQNGKSMNVTSTGSLTGKTLTNATDGGDAALSGNTIHFDSVKNGGTLIATGETSLSTDTFENSGLANLIGTTTTMGTVTNTGSGTFTGNTFTANDITNGGDLKISGADAVNINKLMNTKDVTFVGSNINLGTVSGMGASEDTPARITIDTLGAHVHVNNIEGVQEWRIHVDADDITKTTMLHFQGKPEAQPGQDPSTVKKNPTQIISIPEAEYKHTVEVLKKNHEKNLYDTMPINEAIDELPFATVTGSNANDETFKINDTALTWEAGKLTRDVLYIHRHEFTPGTAHPAAPHLADPNAPANDPLWIYSLGVTEQTNNSLIDNLMDANDFVYRAVLAMPSTINRGQGSLTPFQSGDTGFWADTRLDKVTKDGRYDGTVRRLTVGYTHATSPLTRTGVSISYNRGSANPMDLGGTFKTNDVTVSAYESHPFGHNHKGYIHNQFQFGRVNHSFNLVQGKVTTAGRDNAPFVKYTWEVGREHTWGNGWYVVPQFAAQVGWLGDMHAMPNGLQVNWDSMRSFITRTGVVLGHTSTHKHSSTQWFVNANVYHEFAGSTMTEIRDKQDKSFTTYRPQRGTWMNVGAGLTINGPLHSFYLHYGRDFGNGHRGSETWNLGMKWRV